MDRQLETHGDAGFTLVELLVVAAILSILSLTAALVPARGQGTDVAARIAAQIEDVRRLAIAGQATYGLHVAPRAITILHLGPEGWRPQGQPIPSGARLTLVQDRRGEGPDLFILPDGRISPLELRVGRALCRSDGWEAVTCRGG